MTFLWRSKLPDNWSLDDTHREGFAQARSFAKPCGHPFSFIGSWSTSRQAQGHREQSQQAAPTQAPFKVPGPGGRSHSFRGIDIINWIFKSCSSFILAGAVSWATSWFQFAVLSFRDLVGWWSACLNPFYRWGSLCIHQLVLWFYIVGSKSVNLSEAQPREETDNAWTNGCAEPLGVGPEGAKFTKFMPSCNELPSRSGARNWGTAIGQARFFSSELNARNYTAQGLWKPTVFHIFFKCK